MTFIGLLICLIFTTSLVESTLCTNHICKNVTAELKKRCMNWSTAAALKSSQAVMDFYAEGAIAYPPNRPLEIGKESIGRNLWDIYFADLSFSISWNVDRAGGNATAKLGYTAGTYQTNFTGFRGYNKTIEGKYIAVWELQSNGTWMCSQHIWNTDAEYPETALKAGEKYELDFNRNTRLVRKIGAREIKGKTNDAPVKSSPNLDNKPPIKDDRSPNGKRRGKSGAPVDSKPKSKMKPAIPDSSENNSPTFGLTDNSYYSDDSGGGYYGGGDNYGGGYYYN